MTLLSAGPAGEPVRGPRLDPTVTNAVIGIPADIEQLRRTDPPLALSWRSALRATLAPVMADSALTVTGFARSGWYLVERRGAGRAMIGGDRLVRVTGVELRTIRMPLKSPFETSFGVESERVAVLIRVLGISVRSGHQVTSRCRAGASAWRWQSPRYSSEYAEGAAEVLRRFLVPRLLARRGDR